MKQVLIDVSFIAHRTMHTMKGLEFDSVPTGILFGFFNQLLQVCNTPIIQSNQVHLFFDSRQSYRQQQFPAYKEKRRKDRTPEEWTEIEEMQKQVERLRSEILPSIGFPCYRQTGLESDDLIAQFAIQNRDVDCIIVTSDQDLFQCITNKCHWYDPLRKVHVDPSTMRHSHRVGPEDWAWVKSVAGCGTDGVPGIPGVGEKTAVDYLWKLLPKHHKRHQAIESEEGKAIIQRNAPLVTLPHARTKPILIWPVDYKTEVFFDCAKTLGFDSFLDGVGRRQWDMFFAGQFGIEDRQMPIRRAK